jgi:RNA polymerase sigma-70 factor (ECF subfamily)
MRLGRTLDKSTRSIHAPVEDDAALVSAAQHDLTEFTALYDRYFQPVYRYLSSRVRSVPDAEDLTAQTFLAAIEALPHYHHRGHFSGWLFTIARNKLRDFCRQRPPDRPLDESHPDRREDPLAHAIHSDEIEQLALLVGGLDEADQELIRLRCAADLSFSEIAAAMGRKEEAVKKTFYRLAARLLRQLGGEP